MPTATGIIEGSHSARTLKKSCPGAKAQSIERRTPPGNAEPRRGDQLVGDTRPARRRVDVDLLDFVVDHYDESDHIAIDHSDRCRRDTGCCAPQELLGCTFAHQCVRNVPDLTIAPAVMPDTRDLVAVGGARQPQLDRRGRAALA